MTQKTVLVFVKVPTEGNVKTRLAQGSCLTNHDVTLIAEAMLKDTIMLASESIADSIEIGYYPESDLIFLKKLIEPVLIRNSISQEISFHLQKGTNFDERFGSVVRSSLVEGEKELIVLGADLPYLDHNVLNKAFTQLDINKDEEIIIIGPSNGGGIYLVGINNTFNADWFSKHNLFRGGIEITQFIKFCRQEKVKLSVLPAFGDIDLEEDLISLICYVEALANSVLFEGYHYPAYTAEVINKLEIGIKEVEGQTRKRTLIKK